jgi:hypothetical protein
MLCAVILHNMLARINDSRDALIALFTCSIICTLFFGVSYNGSKSIFFLGVLSTGIATFLAMFVTKTLVGKELLAAFSFVAPFLPYLLVASWVHAKSHKFNPLIGYTLLLLQMSTLAVILMTEQQFTSILFTFGGILMIYIVGIFSPVVREK